MVIFVTICYEIYGVVGVIGFLLCFRDILKMYFFL